MRVSNHVVERWQARAGDPGITKAAIEAWWRVGERVNVSGRNVEEARYIRSKDILLLKRKGVIRTIIERGDKRIGELEIECEYCGKNAMKRKNCRKCNGRKYREAKDE